MRFSLCSIFLFCEIIALCKILAINKKSRAIASPERGGVIPRSAGKCPEGTKGPGSKAISQKWWRGFASENAEKLPQVAEWFHSGVIQIHNIFYKKHIFLKK